MKPSNSTSDAAALRERVRGALDESYRLDRELGRGGAAVVLLAEDLKHGRDVALKLLHPDVGDSFGTDRFLREIRVAARLDRARSTAVTRQREGRDEEALRAADEVFDALLRQPPTGYQWADDFAAVVEVYLECSRRAPTSRAEWRRAGRR